MIARLVFISGMMTTLASVPALAQSDMASMAHLAAANQLGVLEYCQAQGFTDKKPISAEKSVIARLPASPVATGDAEDAGKSGILSSPNGTHTQLSQLASAHNTTIAALCKQLGSGVVQSVAASSQGGMTGMTMPSMSGGLPQMPSMPSMSSMPSMPQMPAMPGAAGTSQGTGAGAGN